MSRLVAFIAVLLTFTSCSAFAVTTYKCVLTHSIQGTDGNDSAQVVNKDARVYDAGNTFSFSPDGTKMVTSPELTDIIGQNDQPMKAGTADNLMYIHVKNSFVIATETEGYIYGDCVEVVGK
ncbi:MAG: hypothetical protein P4L95_24020 [Rouxiella aceris]|uniref:hypothetical protein n=1 Tax=Rouxiella aceris TaxID=2703884 RepID=UPI0028416B89|nr:hypothetical protein [Rouxiella aceris]MDR3434933.1 hypothetical protein [Rouxiella aceris]